MSQSFERITSEIPAKPASSRVHLLVRNTLASASSSIFAQVLALATFPLLIRQVGTTDYGIFALASAAVGYFAIVNLAARASVVKYTAELSETDRESICGFFTNAVFINSLLGILIATTLVFLAFFCQNLFNISEADVPRARQILIINAAAVFLSQPLSVFGSLLYGFQKYSLVAFLDMIWTFARNAVILAMFFFDGSIFWLVWEEISMQFFKFTALALIVRRKYPFISLTPHSLNRSVIKKIFSYGGWSVFYTVAFIMVYQGSIILTGIFLSIREITYLQISYKIYNLINTVSIYLSSAVLPSSSAAIAAGDDKYLKGLIIYGSKINLSILLPITVTILFFIPEIIRFWMGQGYVESVGNVSRILTLSWVILSPTVFLTQIYFGQKDIGKLSSIALFGAIGYILLAITLSRYFNLNGIVYACSVFYIYIGITGIILVFQKFHISWTTYLKKVFYPTYGINLAYAVILGIFLLFISPPETILRFIVYFTFSTILGISLNLVLNARHEIYMALRQVIHHSNIISGIINRKIKLPNSFTP